MLGISAEAGTLDISRLGMGARTLGMGRAQVAGTDLASVFINPASASELDRFALTSMYTNLNEDVLYSMVGAGFPIMWGNLGSVAFSYLGGTVAGVDITSRDATGRTVSTAQTDYTKKLGIVSYGKQINKNFAVGGAVKLYANSLDAASGGQANGFDLDFGMLFDFRENLKVGLAIQNLLPVDISRMNWGTGAKEDIPINFRGGVAFTPRKDIDLALDYDYLSGLHGGVEWHLAKHIFLRGGAEMVPTGKSTTATNFSAGVGIDYGGVNFDYAYYLDSTLNAVSSHYFSLGFVLPYKTVEVPPIIMAQKPITVEAIAAKVAVATKEVIAIQTPANPQKLYMEFAQVKKNTSLKSTVKKTPLKKPAAKKPAKSRKKPVSKVQAKKKNGIMNLIRGVRR